jgi:hypothetical protein
MSNLNVVLNRRCFFDVSSYFNSLSIARSTVANTTSLASLESDDKKRGSTKKRR